MRTFTHTKDDQGIILKERTKYVGENRWREDRVLITPEELAELAATYLTIVGPTEAKSLFSVPKSDA